MRLLSYYYLILIHFSCFRKEIWGTDAKRPNTLLILGDDVGTGDVPGYWNTGLVSMPNIQQQLLDKGTVFTDAHSTRKYFRRTK